MDSHLAHRGYTVLLECDSPILPVGVKPRIDDLIGPVDALAVAPMIRSRGTPPASPNDSVHRVTPLPSIIRSGMTRSPFSVLSVEDVSQLQPHPARLTPVFGVSAAGLADTIHELPVFRRETAAEIDGRREVLLVQDVPTPERQGRAAVGKEPGNATIHQPVGVLARRLHRLECVLV